MNATTNLKSFENKAHDIRDRAADSLESAAETIRSTGKESAGAISDFTDSASKKLDSTAKVVRGICIREKLMGTLRGGVRRNPMGSLALGLALGLVAGFTLRR